MCILDRTIIKESDQEYLFVPTAIFHKKIHGEETPVEQRLYPGYIFLNTAEPVDFYNRLIGVRYASSFGKYLRVLADFEPEKAAKTAGSRSRRTASGTEGNSGAPAPGDGDGTSVSPVEAHEFHEQTFLARISDEEERFVLALCGLRRDDAGNILRREDMAGEGSETGVVDEAGLLELLTQVRAGNEDIVGARQTVHGSSGERGQNSRRSRDHSDRSFTVNMSHAVKLVKKGSRPGERRPGDVKYRILDGPLKGMEGDIVYVDAHKRTATLRTVFMHREMEIRVPLTIVKTREF